MNSSDVYTGTPPTDNSSGGSTPANANGQWVKAFTAGLTTSMVYRLRTTGYMLIMSGII